MEIISKGVMRSGNVLLRLILNHIFNESNISPYTYRFFNRVMDPGLHYYERISKDKILVTPWRDPRDSIISYIRTEWSKQTTKHPKFISFKTAIQNKFPTIEYILENCEKTAKEQMEIFESIIKMQNQHPKKHILEIKYESFHNNFDYLFNKLEEFFKIKIPLETREFINKEFSKQSTIEHQKMVGPNFNSFHEKSWVHGEHVYKGDNKWREILTPEILNIINPILDPYIKKWESL